MHTEHLIPQDLFARAVRMAHAYQLHQLGNFDDHNPTELNQQQAQRLATELHFLRSVVNDPLRECP